MPNFASITLVGHLGRDVSIKDVGDKKVASVSLAVSKKRNGNDTTSWYDLNFWGRQAEVAAQYLAKGSAVMVVGEPEIQEFELKKGDRAGQMATKVSVFVKEFTMLDGKKKDGDQEQTKQEVHVKQAEKAATYKASAEDKDSEPPF